MSAFKNIDLSYLLDKNCHRGISKMAWKPEDIAASVQKLYEDELLKIVKKHCHHKNLILMGGCALNCTANYEYFKHLPEGVILYVEHCSTDNGGLEKGEHFKYYCDSHYRNDTKNIPYPCFITDIGLITHD